MKRSFRVANAATLLLSLVITSSLVPTSLCQEDHHMGGLRSGDPSLEREELETYDSQNKVNELDDEGYNHNEFNNEDSEELFEEYLGEPTLVDEEFQLSDEEIDEVLTISRVFGNEHELDSEEFDEEEYDPEFDTLEDRIERILQRRLESMEYKFDGEEEESLTHSDESAADTTPRNDQDRELQGGRGGKRRPNKGRPKKQNRPNNKATNNQQARPNSNKKGKYKDRIYRNICLQPPDPYRTCFSRAADPRNDVTGCDRIERNAYNLGAQCFRRGRGCIVGNGGQGSKQMVPPEPYTDPYQLDDEMVTRGEMYIALLQDSIEVTCDEMIRLEEAVLGFLQMNVGSDDTFRPACAFINQNSLVERIGRNQEGRAITSIAIKFEVTYSTKASFAEKLNDERSRKLLNTCDSGNHHLCCSQTSINGNVGAYCTSLGCDFQDCGGRTLEGALPGRPTRPGRPGGSGRPQRPGRPTRPGVDRPNRPRPNRPARAGDGRELLSEEEVELGEEEDEEWLFDEFELEEDLYDDANTELLEAEEDGQRRTQRQQQQNKNNRGSCRTTSALLENRSFMQTLHQTTNFKRTELARSLVQPEKDTSQVAACSLNWYTVAKEKKTPTVTCEEYEEQDCKDHVDLQYGEEEIACLEPSAMPSMPPSMEPSEE